MFVLLWSQLLLELLLDLFNAMQICYKHIEDVHEEVYDEKIFFDKLTGFLTKPFSDNCT